MIVCLAVVGHQNNPLYIQSFTEADDALKLHHIVHCSLDVVEERVNNPKKSGPTIDEAFLGLLYPTENYKVYGYLTNTKVKFILVTTDLDVRDADVRNFFRKFHAAYVDAVTNPFHIPGKKIISRNFGDRAKMTNAVSRVVQHLHFCNALQETQLDDSPFFTYEEDTQTPEPFALGADDLRIIGDRLRSMVATEVVSSAYLK